MKLTQAAIDAIKKISRNKGDIKAQLAQKLNCSVYTIDRYLADPQDDNLTKAAALEIIRKETGLEDSQILEAEEQAKA